MAKKPTKTVAADEERKEFTVRGTTISDEDGKRCAIGETIMLGAALAQKFHDLGYLDIPLDAMYKDDKDAHIAALQTQLAEANAANAGSAVDPSAKVEGADADDSVQGASGDTAESGGGEPTGGDVAAGTDAPKNPRRKRGGKL